MDNLRFRGIRILSLLWAVVLLSGCTLALGPGLPSNQAQRDARAKELKKVILLAPDVQISLLSAGGVKEQRDDWAQTGRGHIERAIMTQLGEKGVPVQLLSPGPDLAKEVEEVRTLYRAVMNSIYTHAVQRQDNPNLFPHKIKEFDYSVGSLEKILRQHKADGLIIVYAEDEISSAGRKAMRVFQSINPFDTADRAGITWLEMALADKSGDILWFSSRWDAGGFDLREEKSAASFVSRVAGDYPAGGKQ